MTTISYKEFKDGWDSILLVEAGSRFFYSFDVQNKDDGKKNGMIDKKEFTNETFTNGVERTLDFRALDDAQIKEASKCALFAAMVLEVQL